MNSKDFIQALRKVIREEVQVAVRTELKQFGSVISETKQNIKPVTTYTETIKPKVKQQPKQYTTNPTLNELLNGTSGFKGDGPMAYLEEQIDYNDFSEWPTMQSNPTPSAPAIVSDVEGRRIDIKQLAATEEGAAVVNALTRDFSQLMKAIDKKKGK
jgi:hypothetical protein